jgi:hypothetical protein
MWSIKMEARQTTMGTGGLFVLTRKTWQSASGVQGRSASSRGWHPALRFGVGPIRTSAGPGVTCPMKNPMLEHRVSAFIALDRAGIADPARSLTAADRRRRSEPAFD